MFPDKITAAVIEAAKQNQIEPAGMLALVEVETGGKMFEQDGRTPSLLFERHVCYREAAKRSQALLHKFIAAGLAIPKWDKATQYKDERTSAQRLDLIERARAIDPEVANRSASWGLGQTMGFLCHDLGFANAQEMVEHMTGSMAGQIDCMVREIHHTHLIEPINAHDWQHVARIYNGAGYAKNQYDVKLADAYKRWTRKLATMAATPPAPPPPEQSLSKDEIDQIQSRLRDLGYSEVGEPDGRWGSRTIGAISAFQAHEGLPVNGHYTDDTRDALNRAEPREPSIERQETTADDLRKDGSKTIEHADAVSWWAKFKIWIGSFFVAGGASEKAGLFDHAQDATDKISQARSMWDSISDLVVPIFAHGEIIVFGLLLVGVGFIIFRGASSIKTQRVADHQSGVHAGTKG